MAKKYMSLSEYARYRGVTPQTVNDAKKTGKVVMTQQGRVNVEKSDAAWAAKEKKTFRPDPIVQPNADKRQKPGGVKETPTKTPVGVDSMDEVDKFVEGDSVEKMEAGQIEEKDLYLQSRAVNEFLKAQKERIKLQQLEDTVIQRDTVIKTVTRISRHNRDLWLNWPKTVSIDMAAELGVEPRAMNDVLSKYVRENLDRAATMEFEEWTEE